MLKALWDFVNLRPIKWVSGVTVALLGIYGTFFYERKPELVYEILANSPVLDVRERVSKLQIIYAGTDLAATRQNVHLIRFRVSNQGGTDILKSHFDDAAPLGFEVKGGRILEMSIQGTPYLQENLRPSTRAENAITFSPVILNAGDAFEVRALVLTNVGEAPRVSPIGKVAGTPERIPIRELYLDAREKGYFAEAFGGDAWIQAGRLGGYLIAALLLLITLGFSIGVPYSIISEKLEKRKRFALVEKYKEALGRHTSLKEEFLFRQYIDSTHVFDVFRAIARGKVPIHGRLVYERYLVDGHPVAREMSEQLHRPVEDELIELEAVGLIVRDGPQVAVSPDFQAEAQAFLNFAVPAAQSSKSATA
jgi:hypothetical protein